MKVDFRLIVRIKSVKIEHSQGTVSPFNTIKNIIDD